MSTLKFDPEQYYKEVILGDKDYERVLNMYLQDIGITTKFNLHNYTTLEEVKGCVDDIVKNRLHRMWENYYMFCTKQLTK